MAAATGPEWRTWHPGGRIDRLAVDRDQVWAQGASWKMMQLDRRTGVVTQANTEGDASCLAFGPDGQRALGRYDGHLRLCRGEACTTFTPADLLLPKTAIRCLAWDASGRLWVGTDAGLRRRDPPTWQGAAEVGGSLATAAVYYLAPDSLGGMWAASSQSVAHWDGSQWQAYAADAMGLADPYLTALAVEPDGTAWVGTLAQGLAACVDGTWQHWRANGSDLPQDWVSALAPVPGNGIWVGTGAQGLAHFDGRTWTRRGTADDALPDDAVMSLAVDPDGDLWVGSWYGLTHLRPDGRQTYDPLNEGLGNQSVLALEAAEDGRLWVSTGLGVASFDGRHWVPAGPAAYSCLWPTRATTDAAGTVWFGGDQGMGLFSWDGRQMNMELVPGAETGDFNYQIYEVLADPPRGLWLATPSGLYCRQASGYELYEGARTGLPYQTAEGVSSLARDARGVLWAGTQTGLIRFDGILWQFVSSPTGNQVTDVAIAPDGAVWCLSGGAVARWDGSTWTRHDVANGPVEMADINSLALDPDGGVWVATSTRVWHYDGRSWSGGLGSDNSGLPAGRITCLACDRRGNLWIGMDPTGGLAVYRAGGVDLDEGNSTAVTATPSALPSATWLGSSYPNPFNSTTRLPFQLARSGLVTVEVYDLAGQRLRRLLDAYLNAGDHIIVWDGTTADGVPVASGPYLFRLTTAEGCRTARAVLLR